MLCNRWVDPQISPAFAGGQSGSTRRTLLHGKINPKDWQVLSLGDVGFLLFFRVVSGDYGKPWLITAPETNSKFAPEKMVPPKFVFAIFQPSIFRCENVSFREGIPWFGGPSNNSRMYGNVDPNIGRYDGTYHTIQMYVLQRTVILPILGDYFAWFLLNSVLFGLILLMALVSERVWVNWTSFFFWKDFYYRM